MTGHHVLPNGLEVRLLPSAGTPLEATLVLVRTGYALEGAASLGFCHLLEHLVFAGTPTLGKEELFRRVEGMGGYLNGFTRDDYMGYVMVGHRDDLAAQAELLAGILFEAALPEAALAEAKEVVLEEIRRGRTRPEARVDETFQALLYEGSSYARTGLGNERTVAKATREELAAHYRRFYRPDNMVLLLAGGLAPEAAALLLQYETPETPISMCYTLWLFQAASFVRTKQRLAEHVSFPDAVSSIEDRILDEADRLIPNFMGVSDVTQAIAMEGHDRLLKKVLRFKAIQPRLTSDGIYKRTMMHVHYYLMDLISAAMLNKQRHLIRILLEGAHRIFTALRPFRSLGSDEVGPRVTGPELAYLMGDLLRRMLIDALLVQDFEVANGRMNGKHVCSLTENFMEYTWKVKALHGH